MWGILKSLIGGGVSWLQANQEIKRSEMEARAKLIQSESTHNHEWELASLADKDRWLRRISFVMLSAPFVWALWDPVAVQNYFEVALGAVPEWYVKMYGAVVGGVWGVAALKNSVPGLIGGIKKAIRG